MSRQRSEPRSWRTCCIGERGCLKKWEPESAWMSAWRPCRKTNVGQSWGAIVATRENIAQYQALAIELEQIEMLTPVVLRMRQASGGPEAMLRLRLARFSLKAQQTETQITLTINQFQLTQLAHRSLDGPWLLPTTTPHGGSYHLKHDVQSAALADSFTFRRGVLVVPSTHATLVELRAPWFWPMRLERPPPPVSIKVRWGWTSWWRLSRWKPIRPGSFSVC